MPLRCIACESRNRETARFCAQCGSAVVKTCAACRHLIALDARFCDACGQSAADHLSDAGHVPAVAERGIAHRLEEKVLRSKRALEGERKQVTVLFADIKGSTDRIEGLDPEQALSLLKPTVDAMMAAVSEFEGTVNRVQGDGIMAIFGAPISHEDHALRACHAALAIQASSTEAGSLPVRIGLNTGEVVVHAIKNDLTMEYEADGPTVHLAARMEQMADPGNILLTRDTFRLTQGFVVVDSLGPLSVKGMSAPVPVFALRGLRTHLNRMEARSGSVFSPFVGRESEMGALDRALTHAAGRRGQVVAMVGEAGVGKSRLVREFTRTAEARDWTVRVSGGDPLGTTTSYQPIINLLTSLFGIDDSDDKEHIAPKITDAVLALDPALAPLLPALWALMGASADNPEWEQLTPEVRRQRIIEAVRTLTLARASALRLLLVFEDLHWIDSETYAILDALVDQLGGTRLMLVVTYRPGYRETWGEKSYYTRLRIDALQSLTADEFLSSTLGNDPDLEQIKQLLFERTQGVPFFMEECIRSLVEAGHLEGGAGDYRLATEVSDLSIPANVQAVLAARIDRLTPGDKEVLQVASVVGRYVTHGILDSLVRLSPDALNAALGSLQSSEFLYLTTSVPEPVYAFRHALTLDVAYSSLLRETRRAIHERLVMLIENKYASRIEEHLAVLGEHALKAELWSEAEDYLARAAERAIARCAYHEAVGLLAQQLTALEQLDPNRTVQARMVDAHIHLRAAYGSTGNVAKMVEHLRSARALADALGDGARRARIELLSASVLNLYEDLDAAIELFEAAGKRAVREGDPALPRLARFCSAMRLSFAGRFERASHVAAGALDGANVPFRHERFAMTGGWAVQMLLIEAVATAHLGHFEASRRAADACVEVASETGRPFDQSMAYWVRGAVELWAGRAADALEPLTRGHDICTSESVGIMMPNFVATLAFALALEGRVDEASALLDTGTLLDEDEPAFWLSGWSAAFSVQALALVGNMDHARQTARVWGNLLRRRALHGLQPGLDFAAAQYIFTDDQTESARVGDML